MNDPNGWPFPDRPGVPLNPERDGAHGILWFGEDETWLWEARRQWWIDPRGRYFSELQIGKAYHSRYIGPCPNPAEVAALVAAGQEAMREACLRARRAAVPLSSAMGLHINADEYADAIRDLPLPSAPDALARIRAEAERRGMERAAEMMDRLLDFPPREPGELRSSDIPELVRRFAAAIRDEAKEIKP